MSFWPGKRVVMFAAGPFGWCWQGCLCHSLNLLVLTDAIQAAIEQLDLLGAVEQKEDQLVLTPLGRKMAAFPLEPKFSKVKTAEQLAFTLPTFPSTISISLSNS